MRISVELILVSWLKGKHLKLSSLITLIWKLTTSAPVWHTRTPSLRMIRWILSRLRLDEILIDRCAGHLIAEWLRKQGHDVVDLRELRAEIQEIWLCFSGQTRSQE